MSVRSSMRGRRWSGLISAAVGLAAVIVVAVGPVGAADLSRSVALRVLVLSDSGPGVVAVNDALTGEGVPTTVVDLGDSGRPTINDAYLQDAAQRRGRFQGIVLPTQSSLSADEIAALSRYERRYGVREVNAAAYPSAAFGLGSPAYSGAIDGSPVTVTAAGRADAWRYLRGALTIDDFDPAVNEVSGAVAAPLASFPAGQSYVSYLDVMSNAVTGSLIGANTVNGREQLVITATFNRYQQVFREFSHGITTWLTRGVHLGYKRSYFAVHIDDVFLADARWHRDGNCTPGDDCFGDKATLTTPEIRMTPADVAHLVQWQTDHDFALDLVFNGGGSDTFKAENGNADPLLDAFIANRDKFLWINHTYSHQYLGCIQVAPATSAEVWHCATQADYDNPSTPFFDSEVAHNDGQFDPATGIYWLKQAAIEAQLSQNIAWAGANQIPVTSGELVSGEHSGLKQLPQGSVDNPYFAPALAAQGVTVTAADASRESSSRVVGSTRTIPRHPMNIFFNVATYQDEVDEYNWLYTARPGGSGVCQDNPLTTTCITPLAAGSEAEAQDSFNGYIKPLEVRNALGFVLAGDPRPFYAHQSNLAEGRIAYDTIAGVLDGYRSVFAASAPLVHVSELGQATALARQQDWAADRDNVTAYLDDTGVHVEGNAAAVPLTVPADATAAGLEAYAGEQSGWIAPPAGDTVVATPATPMAGYLGVPEPPTGVVAAAGNASATVTWTAPDTNGSPVTGYTVSAFVPGNPTAAATATVAADATSAVVTGLTNYTSYEFRVVASSAVGASEPSAASAAVIPVPGKPGPPIIGTATAGPSDATATWSAPDSEGGSAVSLYTVRLYANGVFTQSADVSATTFSYTFTGLTTGTPYAFDVFAYNSAGAGEPSARSNTVTPQAAPNAPTGVTGTRGNGRVTVAWVPPASTGGSPITGYQVRTYVGSAATATKTTSAGASATSLVITGLTNGTAYTFDVAAVNAVSTGPASARSAAVTPATTPGAPRSVSGTRASGAVTVAWQAPTSSGGTAVTKYTVRAFAGSSTTPVKTVATANGTTLSLTVTGLTNGIAYRFDVMATNAVGNGPLSPRSAAVTPSAVPGAPVIGTAASGTAGGTRTATARWSPPANNGGAAISGYTVTAYRVDVTSQKPITSAVLSASARSYAMTLPAGAYQFTVQARNANGASAASARSNRVTAQ